MFDPNQKSDGLALTCGNHCALKVSLFFLVSFCTYDFLADLYVS